MPDALGKRDIMLLEVRLQLAHFSDTIEGINSNLNWGPAERVRLCKSLGKELQDLGKALLQVDSVEQLK
jgi:hypothetical protein